MITEIFSFFPVSHFAEDKKLVIFTMFSWNHFLFLSIVLLIKECATQEQCLEGFFHYDNACYFFSSHMSADWLEAGSFCKRFPGGDLVAIETQSENNFIKQQLLLMHGQTFYWTGGTDEFFEGHWVWISTMQKLSYTDWSPGNPSSYLEDCMEIIVGHSDQTTKWNDVDCSKKANFICEVPYMYHVVNFRDDTRIYPDKMR